MPTEYHERLVRRLESLGCSSSKNTKRGHKFRDVLRSLVGGDDDWDEDSRVDLLPDAWQLFPEDRVLIAYEAMVTHDLSPAKFRKYIWLWFFLDCEGVDFGLVIYTGSGGVMVDLRKAYYDILPRSKEEAGKAKLVRMNDYLVLNPESEPA